MIDQEMGLPAGWYVFGRSSEFKIGRPQLVRRFGLNLAVWKTARGEWVAQIDRCPHRSASLSQGKITAGETLACPFHGFEFGTDGRCRFAPEIGRDAPGLKVKTWRLAEKFDFLWIPWKNPSEEIPWFSDLSERQFGFAEMVCEWPTHFSRCVENQLDYSHLPFVHKTTIGRGLDPQRKVSWDLTKERLRVFMGSEVGSGGFFEFIFPNIWRLRITPKYFQMLAFVPVDSDHTKLYLRTYLSFLGSRVLSKIVARALSPVNRMILNQDRRVVLRQRPANVQLAMDEQLMPADRAIQSFRSWLKGEGANSL